MKKRYRDADIWDQSWFLDLSPESKLVWDYINDKCHTSGIWNIDIAELMRRTGLKKVDLNQFIKEVNRDYDKFTGEEIFRERARIINKRKLWMSTHLSFQWGKEIDGLLFIKPTVAAVIGGLKNLQENGLLEEALDQGFINIKPEYQNHIIKIIKDVQGLATVSKSYQPLPSDREREEEGEREESDLLKEGIDKGRENDSEETFTEEPAEDEKIVPPDDELEWKGVEYFYSIMKNLLPISDELIRYWTKWVNLNYGRGSPITQGLAKEQFHYLREFDDSADILKTAYMNQWKGLKYGTQPRIGDQNSKGSTGNQSNVKGGSGARRFQPGSRT